MIEQNLIQQVKGIYTALESQYVLRLEADPAHESFAEFKENILREINERLIEKNA